MNEELHEVKSKEIRLGDESSSKVIITWSKSLMKEKRSLILEPISK